MSTNIILAIIVTSLATFSSRFLGAISSNGIKESSKLFRWFNCLAYSTLAALIARTIIFPVGVLSDASYLSRATVVLFCLFIFFVSKRNFINFFGTLNNIKKNYKRIQKEMKKNKLPTNKEFLEKFVKSIDDYNT